MAAPAPATDEPPAQMSTVGGERLGLPGTQVSVTGDTPPPPDDLTARSWIVADAESGDVLAAHNAHWKLAPASTLKMLFADTLLPKLDKNAQYTVSPEDLAPVQAGSSLVGVKEEYTYTVHDLWLGVFLSSGNDAVHVLAAMNGGVEKTVEEMQRHAEELQALDTHVVSPDGFDAPGQVSSAYDLTLIARSGLQKPDFREYAATTTAQFPAEYKDKDNKVKRESYAIQNTNRLLVGSYGLEPYKGLAGVKNGYTSKAGNTFTGVAERDGRTLLVTVMHPDSGGNKVYTEAAQLLDWGFSAADGVKPVGKLVPPKNAQQAAGNPGKEEGKGEDGIVASGSKADTAQDATGNDAVWSAIGLTGAVLLLIAGAAVLVHRRWPLPATTARGGGTRPRSKEPPKPAPEATAEHSGDAPAEPGSEDAAATEPLQKTVTEAGKDSRAEAGPQGGTEAKRKAEPGAEPKSRAEAASGTEAETGAGAEAEEEGKEKAAPEDGSAPKDGGTPDPAAPAP